MQASDHLPVLGAAALSALRQGNQIEAIRSVRQEHAVGLREAQLAVEEAIAADPRLATLFAERRARTRRTALLIIVQLAALAILAWYLFR